MARHDDEISQKRRRLFKALSVTPAVLTLRPGSALATSSAFQCVKEHREEQSAHHWKGKHSSGDFEGCDNDGICSDRTDRSLFKKFTYWQTDDPNDVMEKNHNTTCPSVVVEDEHGALLDLEGNPVPNVRRGAMWDGKPLLEITKVDDSNVVCWKVKPSTGYGAYVGHTSDSDTKWNKDGYSPKHKHYPGGGMGEKQKISMSCMTSFTNALAELHNG